MTTTPTLYKSSTDRVLCGVSGGLAEYFGVDSLLVRVGLIVLACLTAGVAVLGYLFLCILVPDEDDVAIGMPGSGGSFGPPNKAQTDELSEEARVLLEARRDLGPEYEDELLDSFVERAEEALKSRRPRRGRQSGSKSGQAGCRGSLPLLALCVGAVVLLANTWSMSWLTWMVLCPLFLIVAGTVMLARRPS